VPRYSSISNNIWKNDILPHGIATHATFPQPVTSWLLYSLSCSGSYFNILHNSGEAHLFHREQEVKTQEKKRLLFSQRICLAHPPRALHRESCQTAV